MKRGLSGEDGIPRANAVLPQVGSKTTAIFSHLGAFFARRRVQSTRDTGPTRMLHLALFKFLADYFVQIG